MTVKATLMAHTVPGEFAQQFDLHFQGYSRPVTLSVAGEARLPYPARVELGPFDTEAHTTIDMFGAARDAGFRVRWIESRDDRVRVSAGPDGALDIQTSELPVGTSIETFADVTFIDQAPLSEQRIRITGMASGGLVVEPASISFGLTRRGAEPLVREVRVRSCDGTPFVLKEVSNGDDQLSVATQPDGVGETVVRITLTPVRRGALDQRVRLATPSGRREITIHCIATIE